MGIRIGEAITYPASKYHYEHYVLEEKVADKIVMKTNGYFNTGVPMQTKLRINITEEHITQHHITQENIKQKITYNKYPKQIKNKT